MSEPNDKVQEDLDLLYKEYIRLNTRLDAIMDSSFDDFKLLGAIGAFIAWPPIAQSNLFSASDSSFVLFVGFTGIQFVIIILGLRDLIKQSVMQHYMFELQLQEEDIRTKLHDAKIKSFQPAGHWLFHREQAYRGIISRFYLWFYIFTLLFPIGVLGIKGAWPYAITSGIITLLGVGLHVSAAKLLAGWRQIS